MIKKVGTTAAIDWDWVRSRTISGERIPAADSGKASAQELLRAVDESIHLARHLACPLAVTRRKKILGIQDGRIALEGGIRIAGRALSSYIKDASEACLFLVSIGGDLEGTASMLMRSGDNLNGYLLDRIGSFAVESLAGWLEKDLRRSCRTNGMSVSMRLSPGYCDWPIEEQRVLAGALDYAAAGVDLTDGCMMSPKKSISGLIGIAAEGRFSATKSQCGICNMRDCDYRRTAAGISESA